MTAITSGCDWRHGAIQCRIRSLQAAHGDVEHSRNDSENNEGRRRSEVMRYLTGDVCFGAGEFVDCNGFTDNVV